MEKREATITFKVTEYEAVVLRQLAADCDMDLSEVVNGLFHNMPNSKSMALCALGGALVGTGIVSLGKR